MPVDEHVAFTFREEPALRAVVAAWLAPPLRRGGSVVLACTPAHAAMARDGLQELGIDPDRAEVEGRFVPLDADALMARFMMDGAPDADAFRRTARGLFRDARATANGGPVRAWGEMVDILVKRGDVEAADALERLWNQTIREERIQLLCSYELDALDPERHAAVLQRVCETHTSLVPQEGRALDAVVPSVMRDVLGSQEEGRIERILGTRDRFLDRMSEGAATLTSLRLLDPALGEEVSRRARERLALARVRR